MPRDLLGARRDDHLIDIGLHHHIAVRINDRDRVVGVLVSDQRLTGDPPGPFVADIERCRGEVLEDRPIGGRANADRRRIAAQGFTLPFPAADLQHRIEFDKVATTRKCTFRVTPPSTAQASPKSACA